MYNFLNFEAESEEEQQVQQATTVAAGRLCLLQAVVHWDVAAGILPVVSSMVTFVEV